MSLHVDAVTAAVIPGEPVPELPGPEETPESPGERTARAVLRRHGRTPLAEIALRYRYRVFATPDGNAAVAWAQRGRLALALGDPAALDARDRDRAVAAFTAGARERGRVPAFVPVSPAGLDAYRDAGLHLLRIGHTARVDLENFSLRGNARRSLRQSVTRAGREGLAMELWEPPLTPARVAALAEVSTLWLGRKGLAERRFGAGWFDPARVAESRVAVVRGRFGRVEAFTTLLDGYDPGEGGADLMRRRPGAPAGAMDLLFAELAFRYREEGRRWLNLGLAPLAGLARDPEATRAERALAWLYRHGGDVFDFAGLHAFKAKFRPRWEPRYLAYGSRAALPAVLHAAADPRLGQTLRERGVRWAVRAVAGMALAAAPRGRTVETA